MNTEAIDYNRKINESAWRDLREEFDTLKLDHDEEQKLQSNNS